MTIDGPNMRERLPFLLERAAELGVPVEVRHDIRRAGPVDEQFVASATVTVHADVGTIAPNQDVRGICEAGSLVGTWLQVVGAQDLEFAANLRRHQVVDVDAGDLEPAKPQVYEHSRPLPAAAILLDVELQQDELADAVRTLPESLGNATIEEIVVDWSRVTAPTRSHGAITLALMARSLLHGDVVDVSGLTFVHHDYAAIAAHAFSCLAATARTGADSWGLDPPQPGDSLT